MPKFFRSFDGTRIHYLHHQGKKDQTLVFLHGVGGNWTLWKKEINYFQRKGYSTLTFDFRGHGLSAAPSQFEKYQLPFFSRDLYEILRAEKVNQFVLIGHSLGGAVALNYCMKYKQKFPSSVVFVESASTYPFKHDGLMNTSPYVTHLLRFIANHEPTHSQHRLKLNEVDLSGKGVDQEFKMLAHILHVTPLRTIVKTLDNVEMYVFKNQKKIDNTLRKLKIPALVIAGEKDLIVPVKYSKRIKELDPRAEFKIVKGAHHKILGNFSKQVNTTIHHFLEEHSL